MIAKVPADVDSILMLLDNAGQIQAFLKQWAELRKDRPDIYTDDLIAYLDPPEDVRRFGFVFYHSYPIFDEKVLHDFTTRYVNEFKSAPEGSSAAVAYDETMMLLGCIKSDSNVEAVRACVSNTTSYQGYSGTFSFNGGQTVTDRVIGVRRF
jgi:ABC-type branched-subunit amino acid transport system substrate-binding protein